MARRSVSCTTHFIPCEVCGRVSRVFPSRLRKPYPKRFCSLACKGKGLSGPDAPAWRGDPRRRESYTIGSSGCWLWKGGKARGYGYTWYKGKLRSAHRVFYELTKGPIPPGMEIDHLCRNRDCVNPDHLEVVTHRENILRGARIHKELEGVCWPR